MEVWTRTSAARIALLGCFCVACSVNVQTGNHSGTVTDDYVEEPISAASKKYEEALRTSNAIVAALEARDFQSAYDRFDTPVHDQMDEGKFAEMMQAIEKRVGLLEAYKPLQWNFVTRKEVAGRLLYSTKIVEYEKGMMSWAFVFKESGPYDKPVGFHFEQRPGKTSTPH
jgi:hypothetical protein